MSSHTDFNTRHKLLTAKILKQGYRYHKLRKAFSKYYRRHYDLVSKFNVRLKPLLTEGLKELDFYGDFVYNDFSDQFRKTIIHYKLKEPHITWMLCDRLYVWWLTQSRLSTCRSGLRILRLRPEKLMLLQRFSVGLPVEYSSCFM